MKAIIVSIYSLSFLALGILTADAKDVAEQEAYKIGQTFTLWDYTYTVTKFEKTRKIDSKYDNKEATASNAYEAQPLKDGLPIS